MKLWIIEHRDRGSWANITDGKHIVYAQRTSGNFYHISTVHKPCKDHGTGFRLFDCVHESKLLATIREKIGAIYPVWATGNWGVPKIEKYKNADEFIKYQKRFFDDVRLVELLSVEQIKNVKI